MNLIGIDHVVLCVRDVEKARDFYSDLLGMEPREERPGKWALHFGSQKISLQDEANLPEIARGTIPGTANFCLLAEDSVDFLVDRVGHERANAEAEVRRSFAGSYSPLYQVAYMIGGLQFRALYDELVGSGSMTAPEFHDAILQGGRMPVEMVRARLMEQPLSRDHRSTWRFADERAPGN